MDSKNYDRIERILARNGYAIEKIENSGSYWDGWFRWIKEDSDEFQDGDDPTETREEALELAWTDFLLNVGIISDQGR